MSARRIRTLLPVVGIVSFVCVSLVAQTQHPSRESPLRTAEGVVTELYKSVTFEAGTLPDWQKVRSLFIDEAVVVLRTSRDKTSVFSVQGFVEDFVNFIERTEAQRRGFTERIIRTKSVVYGDIAHVLVLYEASMAGSARPPQRGVDSFQLIRRDGRWWIVSITNELVTADRAIPLELRKQP